MNRVESGFTYIETLVAMFILAFGSLALAQLFLAGVQINVRTKGTTQATNAAQKYLERLYQRGYDDLAAGTGGSLTTALEGFSIVGVQLENSATILSSSQFHQNRATYDIYWQIAHCGNATPTDPCTDSQLIAGQPWIEISVRAIDKHMKLGAKGRETTVRVQSARLF